MIFFLIVCRLLHKIHHDAQLAAQPCHFRSKFGKSSFVHFRTIHHRSNNVVATLMLFGSRNATFIPIALGKPSLFCGVKLLVGFTVKKAKEPASAVILGTTHKKFVGVFCAIAQLCLEITRTPGTLVVAVLQNLFLPVRDSSHVV